MGLFDLVFDELAKEIKEAPGWLALVIVCIVLVLLDPVDQALMRAGLENEKFTAATLAAMILFFLGDLLDTLLFPREPDAKKAEKVLKTSMLLLGGIGVFLLLTGWLIAGVAAILFWILVFPIYRTSKKRPPDPITEKCPDAEAPKASVEEKGYPTLVLQYEALSQSKRDIRKALGIWSGIYPVSTALTRRAHQYSWLIWLPNEAGKFIRSSVLPALIVGIVLLLEGKVLGTLLVVAAPGLLLLAFWLKALHIRRLYRLALQLSTSESYGYSDTSHDVRVFFWCSDVVNTARVPHL